jgi:hypothetical protein
MGSHGPLGCRPSNLSAIKLVGHPAAQFGWVLLSHCSDRGSDTDGILQPAFAKQAYHWLRFARRDRLLELAGFLLCLVCLPPDDEGVDDRVDLFRDVYDSGGGASDLAYLWLSSERIESSC